MEIFSKVKFSDSYYQLSWQLLYTQYLIDEQNNILKSQTQLFKLKKPLEDSGSFRLKTIYNKIQLLAKQMIEDQMLSIQLQNSELPILEALSMDDIL